MLVLVSSRSLSVCLLLLSSSALQTVEALQLRDAPVVSGNADARWNSRPFQRHPPALSSPSSIRDTPDINPYALVPRASSALPSGWTQKGCFVDLTESRALKAYSTTSSGNTPSSCIANCAGRGYSYAGVEFANECFCAGGITVTGQSGTGVALSDCSTACAGDASQQCGGSNRVMVYTSQTSGLPSGWTSLGCYADGSLRVLQGYSTSASSNTPSSCVSTCSARGYTFAGVEYGSECYCSNAITGSSASSSECNTSCSGDGSQTCGGTWRINVYASTPTLTSTSAAPSATSGWSRLGCYSDTSNSRALGSYSTSSSSNTPGWCQAKCSSQGYSYAGVQYGQECYCASSITTSSDGGVIKADSECNISCAGDSSKTCGGNYRMEIYRGPGSGSPTTTTTSSAPVATSTPNTSGKIVVAHYMVGNAYSSTVSSWQSEIQLAMSGGIDGFALNTGIDSWQPDRVSKAYSAAQSISSSFKLFMSLDMTSLPCGSANDAGLVRNYINSYVNHPNQLYYKGKLVVSTFAGENCRFGQGDLNSAWNYALKQGVNAQVLFIPSFFSDTGSFVGNWVVDGDFNWNGGWPLGNFDVNFDTDNTHIDANSGKTYIAAVSPLFYTHYGADSWNKNWIYRSDNWMYNTRWEELVANRNRIDIVEIISWNDYGESHYIGNIGPDQPRSQAWVNGFDHTAWTTMTKYYANWWRTGVAPAITKDQIYLFSRPHSRDLNLNDPAGKPNNWQWTDDQLYAVVFATQAGTLSLSIGSSSSTSVIVPGVNKVKLGLSPGSPRAVFTNKSGGTIVNYAPGDFTYGNNNGVYNFNYWIGVSS